MGILFCKESINENMNEVELRSQIEKLSIENRKLSLINQQNQRILQGLHKDREASRVVIRQYVDDLLKDENVNITGFPDFLEKKIYTNIVTLIVTIIDKVLSSAELRLLNHRISIDVSPTVNESHEHHDTDNDHH